VCLWSRRTRDAARDEAMKNTRGRGGYARVERREARKKFGVECAGGMTRKREREREKEAQTEFFQAHTHTCIYTRKSTERQFPSGTATVPICKNSKITITNIYLI
jgi:hypothetical protein